jgi:hypothetical protein
MAEAGTIGLELCLLNVRLRISPSLSPHFYLSYMTVVLTEWIRCHRHV